MTSVSRMTRGVVAGIVLLGLVTAAAAAAERRSGQVVGVDDTERLIVIDEIGPWQVRQGVTQVTRHVFSVPPSAKIASHIRLNIPGRFQGDFIEVGLELSDVSVGHFVTVEYRRERNRLIATSIAVAELGPAPLP
jgi:hypothetical protein